MAYVRHLRPLGLRYTMARGKLWTETERKNLRDHFSNLASSRLADAFPGRTPRAINDQAQSLGVKKSRERLAEMGRANAFVRWRRGQEETPEAG